MVSCLFIINYTYNHSHVSFGPRTPFFPQGFNCAPRGVTVRRLLRRKKQLSAAATLQTVFHIWTKSPVRLSSFFVSFTPLWLLLLLL